MNSSKFLWGLLFIFVGIVYLGINFGRLPSDIWAEVWKYWPLVLIALGLAIAFEKKEHFWLAIVLVILAVLIIFQLFIPQKAHTNSPRNEWQKIMNEMMDEMRGEFN